MERILCCLFAFFAVSFAFAFRDELSSDSEKARFARDVDGKKQLAFAFAKRATDDESMNINSRKYL